MDIDALFQNYISSGYVKIRLKESTVSTYTRNYERYIKRFFTGCEINDETIAAFTEQLLGFLNEKTVCDILTLLSNILKYSNIYLQIYKPLCYVETVQIFSNEEWNALQDYCFSHLSHFTFCLLLSMYTGIRPGELCALRLQHLDLKNSVLKIRFTMQRIKNLDNSAAAKTKVIIDRPKSRNSLRDIPLLDELSAVAKNLYGTAPGDVFLLTNQAEKFIEPRMLGDKFKKILAQLNISCENKNMYTIRHTFATHFYNATHDAKTLSELLGHADVKITLDRYVHSNLQQKRDGLNRLVQNKF